MKSGVFDNLSSTSNFVDRSVIGRWFLIQLGGVFVVYAQFTTLPMDAPLRSNPASVLCARQQ